MNPPAQPPAAPPPTSDNSPLKPDIVQNIPMQVQGPSQPSMEKDDVELDLMMQDVGQELKKNVKRPAKHHFFSRKSKEPEILQPKTEPRPLQASQPVSTGPQPMAPIPAQQSQPEPQHQARPAPKVPSKPKTKQSVPIFIILVAVIVTAVLVVVAVAAYKQK